VSESGLKDPLPWDTVPAAPFAHLNRVAPYVNALRKASLHRVATEKDFSYLAADVARIKTSVATKSISLNETDRRREIAQAKERREARERSERAVPGEHPTTYVITLENVSSPGLPPPLAASPSTGSAPFPAAPRSTTAEGLDDGAGDTSADEVILNEGVQILADYVGLAKQQPARPDLADN
jgi:hypothetical protein